MGLCRIDEGSRPTARGGRRRIDALTRERNPNLRAIDGVGPLTAGLIVGRVAAVERIATEQELAALAGVAPLDCSSGRQQRHRINRRGDRQLNCGMHRITITQLQRPGPAREYHERRLTEGKTPAEIRRCLKRYISRRVYNALCEDLKLRQQQEKAHMNLPTDTPPCQAAA